VIVTIWRHGEAGQAALDRERRLTDRGCDDIGFGSEQLHRALSCRDLPAPDIIFYSPWVRTRETADLVASAFSHAGRCAVEALGAGSSVDAVDRWLNALWQEPALPVHLVLVSHQPLVSQLLGWLLDDDNAVPPLIPGAYATLALEVPGRGCGSLCFWAVPPEYEAGL
jgi:phosphohistidine phosphatase